MFHGRQELTLRLYKAYAPAYAWPGSSTFERYGGFRVLKERAARVLLKRLKDAA